VLHAQDKSFEAAVAFGARPSVIDMTLSPDGKRVAYLVPTKGQGTAVLTRELEPNAKAVAAAGSGDALRFTNCGWVSNDRLACTLAGLSKQAELGIKGLAHFTRVLAFDANGGNLKMLSTHLEDYTRGYLTNGGRIIDWLPEEDGAVLMTRQYLPDDHTGSLIGSSKRGLGVDWVDTRTLTIKPAEPPGENVQTYISDGHGTVRILGNGEKSAGKYTDVVQYLYRTPDSRDWKTLGTYRDSDRSGFRPLAVDRDLNVAYGLKKLDGRMALYTVKLDGSLHEELVYSRPDVDVSGVARFSRQQHVVGAQYITDVGHIHFFDPKLEQQVEALHKAMPQRMLQITQASLDESRLLLWGASDSDPGVSYIFDRPSHQLNTYLVAREELEGVKLAQVKPVSYPAGDGTKIPAYLTLPPGKDDIRGLPAIVMPHGGPSSRDTWGFNWLAQFFANRGYAVLQPNYRGSSGYGDAWSVNNAFQSWSIAIGDIVAAGHWLVTQGVEPGKLAIVGWSYGGYAALQSAVVDPDLFKAVIAIAPVTDLGLLKEEHRYFSDFQVVSDFVGSGASMREGSPVEHADRFKAPVLMFHGAMDFNVSIEESRNMAARLKRAGRDCELITWEQLDHQLDDSQARAQMLRKSDAFLRKALGL
jgi:dipeptidyl aminopeptidase/acylaminoacyl peptidase